jgi:hypothetical protein
MNSSVNWKHLPDPITEPEIKLELKWSADLRTRRSILRQARLMGFSSPTAYLLQALAATVASNEDDTIITDDGRILNGRDGYDKDRVRQKV